MLLLHLPYLLTPFPPIRKLCETFLNPNLILCLGSHTPYRVYTSFLCNKGSCQYTEQITLLHNCCQLYIDVLGLFKKTRDTITFTFQRQITPESSPFSENTSIEDNKLPVLTVGFVLLLLNVQHSIHSFWGTSTISGLCACNTLVICKCFRN